MDGNHSGGPLTKKKDIIQQEGGAVSDMDVEPLVQEELKLNRGEGEMGMREFLVEEVWTTTDVTKLGGDYKRGIDVPCNIEAEKVASFV